jgi:pSer/pThr/pTyr-binding forkhead associated (FHA) protein
LLNGERLQGRRRLEDGDTLRLGETIVVFRSTSLSEGSTSATAIAGEPVLVTDLSQAQRKVLIALCRPFKNSGSFATPATNKEIADELFLSVDAVKTHLRLLFQKFAIEDVPQNQKRARLVQCAFQSGLVRERDL